MSAGHPSRRRTGAGQTDGAPTVVISGSDREPSAAYGGCASFSSTPSGVVRALATPRATTVRRQPNGAGSRRTNRVATQTNRRLDA